MQAWDDHGGDDVEVYGFVSAKVLLCILVQATKAPSDEWDRDDPAGEAVEAWVGVLNSKVLLSGSYIRILVQATKEPSDEWDVPAGEAVEAWVGVLNSKVLLSGSYTDSCAGHERAIG